MINWRDKKLEIIKGLKVKVIKGRLEQTPKIDYVYPDEDGVIIVEFFMGAKVKIDFNQSKIEFI